MSLTQQIIETFQKHSNPENAGAMKKYMKDHFEYYGIKSPIRKEISKEFLKKENLPSKSELFPFIEELWEAEHRELQYLAMEILKKYKKKWERGDHDFLEYLITTKSWWDTIDLTAAHFVGSYFQMFPDLIDPVTEKWMMSDNIWLQRSCILYQLSYKEKTDTDRLLKFIIQIKHNKEFFIQKAIGWSLREYAKRNPEWVVEKVEELELVGLAKREALKNL